MNRPVVGIPHAALDVWRSEVVRGVRDSRDTDWLARAASLQADALVFAELGYVSAVAASQADAGKIIAVARRRV
jgi:hypothetical protein